MPKNEELREMLYSSRLSLLIDLLNGALIAIFNKTILSTPGVLILIPGFIQLRGSIYSMLSSRISSEIATGNLKIKNGKITNKKVVISHLIQMTVTSILISFLLGILTYVIMRALFHINYPRIMLIALIASIISSSLLAISVYYLINYVIKKNLDLDIISGPIITSLSDTIATLCLILTILIL